MHLHFYSSFTFKARRIAKHHDAKHHLGVRLKIALTTSEQPSLAVRRRTPECVRSSHKARISVYSDFPRSLNSGADTGKHTSCVFKAKGDC